MMSTIRIPLPIERIAALCRTYHIKELAVFGSAVRDDFTDASDVDVLVEFSAEAQVSFLTLAQLQRELTTLLQRTVDLVPKNGLKPYIRQSIIASAQVVYAA